MSRITNYDQLSINPISLSILLICPFLYATINYTVYTGQYLIPLHVNGRTLHIMLVMELIISNMETNTCRGVFSFLLGDLFIQNGYFWVLFGPLDREGEKE